MTPSERNALLFLSALLLLGVSVRVVRARSAEPHPTGVERAELTAQIAAVDSVRGARKTGGAAGGSQAARVGRSSAGPRKTAPTSRKPSGSKARVQQPPPDPPLRPVPPAPSRRSRPGPTDSRPTDLDLASQAEIEALPWIGPVLAARIVADRDSLGPFGSMHEFQRVRGVGPSMAGRLEGRVTFSQTPRHFRAEDRGTRAAKGARARTPVRPHAP